MDGERESIGSMKLGLLNKGTLKMSEFLSIGDRIKEVRLKTGLDQKQFAQKVGVTAQIISRTENGRQEISASLLQGMFRAFDINPAFVLALQEHQKSNDIEKLKRENLDLKERLEETRESLRMAKELLDFFRNQK
jgi:transcriptional regulator with XRE-family HTH domain